MTLNLQEKLVYDTIYKNATLFLQRGINEIVTHDDRNDSPLTRETAIFSCIFIQMTIELSMKAFLIKRLGIRTILEDKYLTRTDESIYNSFTENTLKTKSFESLKAEVKNNNLTWFKENDFDHIEQFQKYRNKLVHINLFLSTDDLYDLKYELVYVIVHILIPFLTEISFEYETPSDFYSEYLDEESYKKLIDFRPYVSEMEKLAKEFTGLAYTCPNCYKKTYSPNSNICYCCRLNYEYAADYTDCFICNSKKSVIYDPHNIEVNHNIINGLCLACDEKPYVFMCPKCEKIGTFYHEDDLIYCKPGKCFYK